MEITDLNCIRMQNLVQGVGFLNKNSILEDFMASTCNTDNKGVLLLKLQYIHNDLCLIPLVCYFSTRQIDVQTYYDNLLMLVYKYQKQVVLLFFW